MTNKIEIIIKGKRGSGKTTIGKLLYDYFLILGIDADWEDSALKNKKLIDNLYQNNNKVDNNKQQIIIKS